jgi:hypothetical protein
MSSVIRSPGLAAAPRKCGLYWQEVWFVLAGSAALTAKLLHQGSKHHRQAPHLADLELRLQVAGVLVPQLGGDWEHGQRALKHDLQQARTGETGDSWQHKTMKFALSEHMALELATVAVAQSVLLHLGHA